MDRGRKAQVFAAFAALAFVAVAVARLGDSPLPPREKPAGEPWRRVVAVLDGDTIRLDREETVRLIGVDTPESASNKKLRQDLQKMQEEVEKSEMLHLGLEAKAFVRALAEGKRCWLEYEKKRTDLYGRTLAYIHLENSGILNEMIIECGYGRAYPDYPFRYKQRYVALQRTAMEKRRGLWAEEDSEVLGNRSEGE